MNMEDTDRDGGSPSLGLTFLAVAPGDIDCPPVPESTGRGSLCQSSLFRTVLTMGYVAILALRVPF